MWSRRAFGSSFAASACGRSLPSALAATSVQPIDLAAIRVSAHEQAMRLAIAEARHNPVFSVRRSNPASGGPAGHGDRRQPGSRQ